jgi:hypothetical protein
MVGTVAVGALLYLGIVLWFRANENAFVFFPEAGPVGSPPRELGDQARLVRFPALDGTPLTAWVIPPLQQSANVRWVLVLHGNAGNLMTPGRVDHDGQLRRLGLGVFALDYRGYGESEGSPSEAGVYADARAAYSYLRDSIGVPPDRIVVYGHSLGSAVAVELATEVPAVGLIIEGAFTSVPDRGAEVYPFIPVRLLARSSFNSLERIPRVRMPVLVIHGRDDTTIPIAHGRRLFASAPEPKTFLEVAGAHDDAYEVGAVEYEKGIRDFLAGLP